MSSRSLHLVFTLTRGNFIAYLICISFHKAKENEKTNKKPSFISVCAANSAIQTYSAFDYNRMCSRCVTADVDCVENKEMPGIFIHSFTSVFFICIFRRSSTMLVEWRSEGTRVCSLGRNICALCSLFL